MNFEAMSEVLSKECMEEVCMNYQKVDPALSGNFRIKAST